MPAEQQWRERVRLQAAERFGRGDPIGEIVRGLRVAEGSVRRWYRAWRDGGAAVLGTESRDKLSPAAVGPDRAGTAPRTAGGQVRRGPALDPGQDQDADRQAVPRRLRGRGYLEADAPGACRAQAGTGVAGSNSGAANVGWAATMAVATADRDETVAAKMKVAGFSSQICTNGRTLRVNLSKM
jgi:hypothetical protein